MATGFFKFGLWHPEGQGSTSMHRFPFVPALGTSPGPDWLCTRHHLSLLPHTPHPLPSVARLALLGCQHGRGWESVRRLLFCIRAPRRGGQVASRAQHPGTPIQSGHALDPSSGRPCDLGAQRSKQSVPGHRAQSGTVVQERPSSSWAPLCTRRPGSVEPRALTAASPLSSLPGPAEWAGQAPSSVGPPAAPPSLQS